MEYKCPLTPVHNSENDVDTDLMRRAINNAGFLDLGLNSDELGGISVHNIGLGIRPNTNLMALLTTLDHFTLDTPYFLQLHLLPEDDTRNLRELIEKRRIFILSASIRDDGGMGLSRAEKME